MHWFWTLLKRKQNYINLKIWHIAMQDFPWFTDYIGQFSFGGLKSSILYTVDNLTFELKLIIVRFVALFSNTVQKVFLMSILYILSRNLQIIESIEQKCPYLTRWLHASSNCNTVAVLINAKVWCQPEAKYLIPLGFWLYHVTSKHSGNSLYCPSKTLYRKMVGLWLFVLVRMYRHCTKNVVWKLMICFGSHVPSLTFKKLCTESDLNLITCLFFNSHK